MPCAVFAQAPAINVTGRVTDEKGAALSGVSITTEGSNAATVTQPDGHYSLHVPGNARLTFSFVGFNSQTIDVNGRSLIDVTLSTNVNAGRMNEVVVIGYGSQRKSDVTGALSTVTPIP